MTPKYPLKREGQVYDYGSLTLQMIRDFENADFMTVQIKNGPSYTIPYDCIGDLQDDCWIFDSLDRAARMAK